MGVRGCAQHIPRLLFKKEGIWGIINYENSYLYSICAIITYYNT
jgi:hypothetical protein